MTKWTTPGFAAFSAYMEQPEFCAALLRLEERADRGEAIALMCAETLWWKCHRRLISDAFGTRRVPRYSPHRQRGRPRTRVAAQPIRVVSRVSAG
ncbi:MAG TPA: DUF488 domain-containing protein [Candidatus Limnocylindrales bacterium]